MIDVRIVVLAAGAFLVAACGQAVVDIVKPDEVADRVQEAPISKGDTSAPVVLDTVKPDELADRVLDVPTQISNEANEPRLALVIAQSSYSNSSYFKRLDGVRAEADLIAAALSATGFEVRREHDLTKEQLVLVLDEFQAALRGAGGNAIGFVYYTGHGAQGPTTSRSYLFGVDARMSHASDFLQYGVAIEDIRDRFYSAEAGAVFLVFDACRDTPPVPGEKIVKGISRVESAPGVLIAYATSPGDVAIEGVYAPALAAEIRQTGQTAEMAFNNVQSSVAQKTGLTQRPWTDDRVYKSVCFAECGGLPTDGPTIE